MQRVDQKTGNDTLATGPSSILFQNGIGGFITRALVLTILVAMTAIAAMVGQQQGLWLESISSSFVLIVGLVIWKTNLLGLFFSEYPAGNDNALLRLALATFCRTGLPLLVVFAGLDYASSREAIGLIGAIYCVGFFGSLILDVLRLETALPQPVGQG